MNWTPRHYAMLTLVLLNAVTPRVRAEAPKTQAEIDREIIRHLDFYRSLEMLELQPVLEGLQQVIGDPGSPSERPGSGSTGSQDAPPAPEADGKENERGNGVISK